MSTLLQQMRDQIHEAVSDFPIIDSVEQLFDLPDGTLLLIEQEGSQQVRDRASYFLTQGMSRARGGALWSEVAKVLWIP